MYSENEYRKKLPPSPGAHAQRLDAQRLQAKTLRRKNLAIVGVCGLVASVYTYLSFKAYLRPSGPTKTKSDDDLDI